MAVEKRSVAWGRKALPVTWLEGGGGRLAQTLLNGMRSDQLRQFIQFNDQRNEKVETTHVS